MDSTEGQHNGGPFAAARFSGWGALKRRLPIINFVVSAAMIAFAYGVAVGALGLFPYRQLQMAGIAAKELWAWAELLGPAAIEDHPHVIVSPESTGATVGRHDPARVWPGLTLVEAFDGERFSLSLLDMAGAVRHRWTVPDQVYRKARERGWGLKDGHYEIMGAHLFANGDVVFVISNAGIARIDRCSNLLWYLDEGNHHSVTVGADGSIWALAETLVTEANASLPHMPVPYEEDRILRISPDGAVVEDISILDAIYAGGYQAVVLELEGVQERPRGIGLDPTHSNDIEIVDEAFARAHSFAAPGDIMVSLRNVDALILIDRDRHVVKWALSGLFLRQHDPDLHSDGTITIFDNRTARAQHNRAVRLTRPQSFGYSRIIRFDPATQRVVWQYQGTIEEPFYTSIQGDHQVLANGNVLIAEAEAGRIFEVDPSDNAIVWEWFNVIDHVDRDDLVGRVTRINRYDPSYLTFLDRDCGA